MGNLVHLSPGRQIFRLLAGFLLSLLFTACQGQTKMYQPVPAERYFADNPALPVAQACQHDDAEGVVKALQITHVSPNAVGEQGMSLLLLAISNRSIKAVEVLLTHGADPNLQTELGRRGTLVQSVGLVAGGDNVDILRVLLNHGGDPNSKFGTRSALSHTINGQRFDNMRLLVERGANPSVADNGGLMGGYDESVVMQLADDKKFEQVAYLIEHGADVHWQNKLGLTLALSVQENGFDAKPADAIYPWVVKTKHLLEAKGIRFPVISPAVAHTAQERVENAQRRQWETTPEGRRLLGPIRAAVAERERSQNATQNYAYTQDLRLKAEEAFQAWRKGQPNWVPSVHFISRYYEDPPTLEQEAADMKQRQVKFQADSARWAEQARAIR